MAENNTNNAFTPANSTAGNTPENRNISGTVAQGQAPAFSGEDLNAITPTAGNPFSNSASTPAGNVNAAASTLAATGLASHTLQKPEAGKTATLKVAPGEIISAQFDPNSANLSMSGKDLVMSFEDGGKIILQGFASDISDMPAIALPGGALVSGGIIVAQLQGTNEEIFNLETAANASAAGGGNFIYSDDLGGVIGLLDKLPPILFSALEFNQPEVQVVVADPAPAAAPPANPPGGSFVPNITTELPNPDGSVTIVAGGFEDWQANQHIGDFTVTPMGLNIVFTPQDNEVVDQVTISNIPDGVQFFYRDANGITSPLTITNSTLTLTGEQLASGNIFILPPANSDVDIPFTISLLIRDPETGETAILAQNVLAVVDAVADQPSLDSTISIGGGTFTTGTVTGSEGQVIALRVTTAFPDNDGSETHMVIIKGVPAEWTLVDAQGLTFTSVVEADGTVTYTAIVTGDVNNVISFQPNNWSSEDNGTAVLTVISTTSENVTDGEIRTDNNTASVETTFGVTIDEDTPTLVAVTTPALIPEALLLVPGADQVDGTITVDFHSDGPGDVSLTLQGLDDLGLTSDGQPLVYTLSPDGKTITATTPSGTPIFTVELTPGTTPGDYEYVFTLQGPLDHAPGSGNNQLNIPVNFVATDSDGDTVSGNIPIIVVDDVPTAAPVANTTDETADLGTALVGDLDVNFGADGVGSLELNGFNVSGSMANGTLTSGGQPVVVTLVNGVYYGIVGDIEVFTLTLNPATGQYVFVQNAPLDHADGSNPNDVITLTFNYTATDNDGDSVNSTITINIVDDAPVAYDDVGEVNTDNGLTVQGNVILNDDFSNDAYDIQIQTGPGGPINQGPDNILQSVTFNGTTYSFTDGVPTADENGIYLIIEGDHGTLKIYQFGSYTYTYHDNNFAGTYTDQFTYTLVDFDGDTDTANLTITITDNGPDAPPVIERTIDETDDIGNVISGTLDVPNAETFALATADSSGSMENGALSSGGVPVTIQLINGQYVGMAGSVQVFTLTLNAQTGAYTFTLHAPLDHADGSNPNDIIDLTFGYTATDANGTSVAGTIIVHVLDDAPVAVDDVIAASANSPVVSGDVTANDDIGEDTGHSDKVDSVAFNGTTYSFDNPTGSDANGAYLLIQGQYGTLKIYATGQYTYTYNAAAHAGDLVEQFTYTLIDNDGDTDTANLTINIHDGVPSIISVTPPEGEVNEADLPNNADVSGIITVDFNDEGPGSVKLTDEGLDDLGLTSDGQPLSYTVSPDGQTITATTPDGTVIFTVVVTPGSTPDQFEYTFTLQGPLDHAPGNGTNEIDVPIHFVATDNDGDTASGVIPVVVTDDVPVVNTLPTNLDETTTLDMPFTGSLNVDFGADGPAETDALVFTGFNASGSLLGGVLSSGGVPITMTLVNGVYVAMAGTTQVFTLSMDPVTGQYTFTQYAALDHADGTDINDIITLQFQFDATDNDGDTSSGTITIRIRDDAPIAVDDVVTMNDTNPVATGNVMTNDTMSNDVDNTLQSIAFDGTTYSFDNPTGTDANGAYLIIQGQYGVLKIYQNGQYSYTYSDGNFAGTYTDQFTYTLVDFDGDTDTATLTINITDNGPHNPPVIVHTIDETVDIGNVISGDASISGADSFALTTVESSGSMMGGTLTSGGHPVSIQLINGQYVGMLMDGNDSTPVFTLTLDPATGAYTFVQHAALDHADGSNPNDVINLVFGYDVSDANGNTISSTITIHVRDDAPVAAADVNTVTDVAPIATGNVLTNDTLSQDDTNSVQSVGFGSQTYSFDSPSGIDAGGVYLLVQGLYGTLKIYANGNYTYTYNDTNFAGTYVDQFRYTLVDFDGDSSTTTLTINITDNGKDDVPAIVRTIDETHDIGNVISGSINSPVGESFTLTSATSSGSMMGGTLTSHGQPVTIQLINGQYVGVIAGNAAPVFTLTLNPQTGAYTFVQHAALDHADGSNPNDVINLIFGFNITDGAGNSVPSTITIHVRDDAPIAAADVNSVTDAAPTATGNVLTNDTLSEDDTNSIQSVGFGGQTYSFDNPSGIDSNGIFLLIAGDHGILKIYQNGNYVYTYSNNNFAGDYIDQFQYTLVDFDGDTSTTTLTIKIDDNGPDTAPVIVRTIDETTDIGDAISGTINVDNADSFALTSANASGSMMGGTLTSHGLPVTIVASLNGYVGMVAGSTTPVFTMILNPQTGQYTFTQYKPLDHANGSNPNDIISLKFGYSAFDANGNAVSNTITVHVRDDAPIAVQDYNSVPDHSSTATGNVLLNDVMSVDTSNLISQAGFGNNMYSFDGPVLSDMGGPFLLIQGQYGVLKLYQNGNYVYTYNNANHTGNHTEIFKYTLRDYDGDTSNTTLTINIIDSGPSTPPEIIRTIDETTDIGVGFSGTIPVFAGSDHPLTFSLGNDNGQPIFDAYGSLAGGTLKSHGVAIVVTLENGVYVGKAGNTTIFTLTMTAGGYYTFKQFGPIDHADGSNPNDIISLRFRYTLSDEDGDSASNNIIINVRDDAPVAVADVNTVQGSNTSAGGNVVTNDDLSVDAGNVVSSVSFGMQTINFGSNNFVEINGTYGKLTIYANGQYTYTLHEGSTTPGAGGTHTDVFNYTLRDYDGDSSTTTLTITSVEPKLVVGNNTGDTGGDGPGYHIGSGSGTINGTSGSDILIGDFGGSNAGAGEDFNIVLILDTSNSMNESNKLAMLKAAVNNLLEDFSQYTGGVIKVRFITFNNNVQSVGTFTVTNHAEYLAAIAFVNGLVATGETNYEAPLQNAIQWLNSGNTIPGATNFTYFVSDGEPNRYINAQGNVAIGSANTAMGEITGADGSNEVGMLQGLSTIVAVGIGVNNTTMGRLDIIDSNGDAVHVQNPSDLGAVLDDNSPVPDVQLDPVGNDTINGGDGDDLIFGDSVNTDALAHAMGVDLPAGSGWAVFDFLEAHHAGWTRQSTINYIRTHMEELAREVHAGDGSGRTGGHDTITGGNGNDIIFGQEGNDTINGGAGNDIISGGSGNNTLTGGLGADTFLFIKGSTGHDTITDYSNTQNDKLDISDLLIGTGYQPGGNAANYVKIDADTGQVFVDATGSGNFNSGNHVATINNITSMDTINVVLNDNEGVRVIHTV